MIGVCYLCGESLGADFSADHVPPQQFFAKPIRRAVNLNRLTTVYAHRGCNSDYGRDEEYFVWALAPLAAGSQAGDALIAYNASKFHEGTVQRLALKTLAEFDPRPSGLHLPRDLVAKRLDGERIKRVVWKLVRGLYFVETGSVLAALTPFTMEIREPENRDPSDLGDVWELVKATPSRGTYPGVFDYKYLDARAGAHRLHAWGVLLWDRIMVFVAHQHPRAPATDAT